MGTSVCRGEYRGGDRGGVRGMGELNECMNGKGAKREEEGERGGEER